VSGSADLTSLLADAGSVAGGGAAVFGTAAFVAGSLARDLGVDVDPVEVAERGALFGAMFGLVAYVYQNGVK
jgi:hypothetical protein